jgi:YD repeat-containing protein
MLRALAALTLALGFLTPAVAVQQGGTTRYVYDDNGRLRAVVSPAGEAAVYDYDPAGNFTAIRRLAADALELLDFFPKQGVPGDLVTFIGVGFGTVVNSVSFNGSAAQVVSVSNTMITARVPQAATTGLVTIDTPRGTVITAVPFIIRGVRVDPSTAAIFPNDTFQFAAVIAVAGADQSVKWSVNDIEGGNASVGTVSTNGLYTAPNQMGVFIVRAASNADPSLFGESVVTVQDRTLINIVVAPLLSVRRGSPPGNTTSAGVSVQRGIPPSIISGAGVSLTNGPNISSISPGAFAKGASAAITITGTNFGGAPSVLFFTIDAALDSSITVSGLKVSGDGTSLVATVTVSGSTATGKRVVVISGPTGRSQLADIGANTIQIVP